MQKIKRKSVIFLTLVALIAIFTCVLVDPAIAAFHVDDHSSEMAGDGHCVSSCHMLHHQALSPDSSIPLSGLAPNGLSGHYNDPFRLEEPVSSIFHPPLYI